MPAKWLKVADVAREFSVSGQTVRMWIRDGKLRGYRVGRQFRIDPADMERFKQSGVDAPGPDRVSEAVARIVAAAPPLTPEQRDQLSALLRPAANGRAVAS